MFSLVEEIFELLQDVSNFCKILERLTDFSDFERIIERFCRQFCELYGIFKI